MKLPKVDCSRGAPMGRSDIHSKIDAPYKVHLRKIRLDSGGYDEGGAYWGHGEPLYWAEAKACWVGWGDDDRYYAEPFRMFIRASSRDEAKEIVRESYPNVKFFR